MRRVLVGLCIVVALGAVAVPVAAWGGSATSSKSAASGSAGAANKLCPYRLAVITHGDHGSWWSIYYKGVKQAAADMGCKLASVYGSQQEGQAQPDDNAQNAQINNAINQHVDGIIVSDHAPALMNKTIAKAVSKGIPVVIFNAGCDDTTIAVTHAITCVGQPEQLAGYGVGRKFKSLGKTNIVCVIHQSGQNLLDRCNGVAQALGIGKVCKSGNPPKSGPACTELTLSTPNAATNPQQAVGQVTAFLQAHPQVNGVLALNNSIADAIVKTKPKAMLATFDINDAVMADIQNGSIAFAVDQQPYMQGYVPVQILFLYLKHHGQSLGGGTTVATGPTLITKANIGKLKAAVAAGED